MITLPHDWLKSFLPVFQPIRSKELMAPYTNNLFHISSKLQVVARNFDWFIVLFAPVVIGQSNYFGIGFSTVFSGNYPMKFWLLVRVSCFSEHCAA